MPFRKFRLRIERIHMGRATLHHEKYATFGFRYMVRARNRKLLFSRRRLDMATAPNPAPSPKRASLRLGVAK